MNSSEELLLQTIDQVIDVLPAAWDRIRSVMRSDAVKNFGVTMDQFHILHYIRRGYTSVADLAEKKQISRPAASQMVDALVLKGLVTRQTNPSDHRSIDLALTDHALEVMGVNRKKKQLWMKDQMSSLSAEELLEVYRAMEILKKTFISDEKGSGLTNERPA